MVAIADIGEAAVGTARPVGPDAGGSRRPGVRVASADDTRAL